MENYYWRKGLNSITIGVDVCKLHHNVGTCLRHVSNALINWRFCNHCCLHRNMPKACPYAMIRNLISKYWFIAEGEWYLPIESPILSTKIQ